MPFLNAALRQALPRPVREARSRVSALVSYDRGRLHVPPPEAKRRHLLALFRARQHETLVESGTYLGDTTAFFAPHARRVITVEVDPRLASRARQRFARIPNIEVVEGDAQEAVPRILRNLGGPALVWLDGHYSGEGTGRGLQDEPALLIVRSLREVPGLEGSTIVVDDLRTFGRDPAAPHLVDLVVAAREAFPVANVVTGLDCLIVCT
jgi:hypothetical protein